MPVLDAKAVARARGRIRLPGAWVAAVLVFASLAQVAWASSVVRSFTPRYATTARGEILLIGNANMSCPTGATNCAAARNGTASDNNNNGYTMAYVNSDGVGFTPANSSTASLTIPSGSTVLFAGLYWGADSNAAARNVVQFATPASGYAAVTASQVDLTSTTRYSAFADVTSQVQAGGSGTYKVAAIQASTGGDRYAGWSLVVVVSNPSLAPRNMVVFDGAAIINSSAPTSVTITVSGFRTPPSGVVNTQVGTVAYEGDLSSTGDAFQLNGSNLSNAANPSNNVFNSTISRLGTPVTARDPAFLNNFGFDIDLFGTTALGNNATSATLTFTTGGETYFPAALTFQTDVFEPVILSNVTKAVTDVNGGTVAPGDVLEYTIAASNTGNDGATQMVLTDPIPAGTTYVPNSLVVASGANAGNKSDGAGDDQAEILTGPARAVFRLGTGANATTGGTLSPTQSTSVRFRVQVDADVADGTRIDNQGNVNYVSETLGENKSGPTPVASVTVSSTADLSITKTNTPASGPNDQANDAVVSGTTTSYDLVVSNAGSQAVTNAKLRDPAPTGLAACVLGTPPCAAGSGTATCPTVGGGAGQLSIANLQNTSESGGVLIPSMAAGSSLTFRITCTVP